ncbi:MAG TPA: SPOR domain-containing protein [Bacteroidia bacterium]|nr:SPOR domain-containing protein [Bacteroidia bacterium]
MKTDHHIAALLYDHDCVIIPDFGGFVASYQSAQLNEMQHTFYPPSKKIAFNASLKKNDGLLANHISESEKILYAEACRIIYEYSEECFQALNNGKKIYLDRIGLLFYDAEKNIQFIPDPHQNFLKESFGLALIHSPALNLAQEVSPLRDIQFAGRKKNKKFNWRIVELVPAAAIVVLMFTFPILTKNFDLQWSSLNPFADKNKIETIANPSKQKSDPAAVFYKPPVKNETAKSEAPAAENISIESKDASVNVEQPLVETSSPPIEKSPAPVTVEATATSGLKYHIIAGCFRIEENATKLEADLKSKGFNAEILGKNEAGLTMVSISSFKNLSEAKNSLSEIQNTFNRGVWIFKSK